MYTRKDRVRESLPRFHKQLGQLRRRSNYVDEEIRAWAYRYFVHVQVTSHLKSIALL